MAFEMKRSPEEIQLMKLKKKQKKTGGLTSILHGGRELSPQTHLFMLNLQVYNQSNLTK